MSKCILITGATSGIGLATARLFGAHGYDLILTGRRSDRLKSIGEELSLNHTIKTQLLTFDVRNYEECETAVGQIDCDVDILLNNAGLARGFDFVHEANIRDWDEMIDTNIKGLAYMTRLISDRMVKRGSGHIINIASSAGKEAYPKGNVYNATKFAVEGFTKAIRMDLHKHNIRVSQVSPGHVEETEFAQVRFHGDAAKAKIYDDFNPLTSQDVAEVIYFIATRPGHVNIQDVFMMGTQQASSMVIDRSGRKFDPVSE